MANPEHEAILRQGVEVWNAWRKDYPVQRPNLSGADFRQFDLSGADFSGANLSVAGFSKANFRGADLSEASLFGAYLLEVNLIEATLVRTVLRNADLSKSNLSRSNLTEVDLTSTYLTQVDLHEANLTGSKIKSRDFFQTNFEVAQIDWITIDDQVVNPFDFEEFTQRLKLPTIERTLEFAPEHKDAGVSILGYFSTYVADKYPDKSVKVKIEQDGLTVKMQIDTDEGDEDLVERSLVEYGQVVTGQMKPEDALDDKLAIHRLNSELRRAKDRLEDSRELLEIERSYRKEFADRVKSLEDIQQGLVAVLGSTLLTTTRAQAEALPAAVKGMREQNQTTRQLIALIDRFASRPQNAPIQADLNLLTDKLEIGGDPSDGDKKEIEGAVESIGQKSQEALQELADKIGDLGESALGSTTGAFVYDAIVRFLTS